MIEYKATFVIDIGKVFTEVGNIVNDINNHINQCGYDEKLKIQTEFLTISVSVDHELSEEEKCKMKALLEAKVIEAMPQYDIRLKSFSRKSGNVLQSAS